MTDEDDVLTDSHTNSDNNGKCRGRCRNCHDGIHYNGDNAMAGSKHRARTLHVTDLDGIGHEMTCHVVDIGTDIVLPALITNSIHLPHALGGFRFFIQLYHLGGVLFPTVQSEAMNLQHAMHRRTVVQILHDSLVSNQVTWCTYTVACEGHMGIQRTSQHRPTLGLMVGLSMSDWIAL